MNPILKSIIHKQRRDFERLSSGRHIPEQILEGVWEERNIRYADDGDPAHVMDLFYPNTLKLPAPVIINIHGGGLITGSKEFIEVFDSCDFFFIFCIQFFCRKSCQLVETHFKDGSDLNTGESETLNKSICRILFGA